MICTKCSTMNADGDLFCCGCGASLADQNPEQGFHFDPKADLATINATTTLAAKEARKADISNMRPLTRMAYNISDSENSAVLTMLLSLLHVALSLGLVAVIIKIFDEINMLGQSLASSNIAGSLSDILYKNASADHTQLILWLVLLFVAMVCGVLLCGRLNIRIRKVNRKKKRAQLDSRL